MISAENPLSEIHASREFYEACGKRFFALILAYVKNSDQRFAQENFSGFSAVRLDFPECVEIVTAAGYPYSANSRMPEFVRMEGILSLLFGDCAKSRCAGTATRQWTMFGEHDKWTYCLQLVSPLNGKQVELRVAKYARGTREQQALAKDKPVGGKNGAKAPSVPREGNRRRGKSPHSSRSNPNKPLQLSIFSVEPDPLPIGKPPPSGSQTDRRESHQQMPLFDSESTSPPPAAQQQKLAGEHGNRQSTTVAKPTVWKAIFQENGPITDGDYLIYPALAADTVREEQLKKAWEQLEAAIALNLGNQHIW